MSAPSTTTDRHLPEYLQQRCEEGQEFRHLPPSQMAHILLTRLRHERWDERQRVERLRTPRRHPSQPVTLVIGEPLLRGMDAHLRRLDDAVELAEQLVELMKVGPRVHWHTQDERLEDEEE